ncbi:hypothetical protein KSP40_PGU003465 [Platanthera guangdongensis]|uniref:Uncharacterized protein n=1 Tax=Platanthera guangdongensis TaxID=2320717 RepID=A0ABR2MJ82_9ASPA
MGSNLRQSGDKKLLQHYLCSFKEDIHKDEGSRVRDDACKVLYNIAKGRRNGGIQMSFTVAASWSKAGRDLFSRHRPEVDHLLGMLPLERSLIMDYYMPFFHGKVREIIDYRFLPRPTAITAQHSNFEGS